MIEFLKGWVMNIVIMALFITLIEILTPSGKIKKHINLVSGFILMIAVINPLITLFKGDIDLKQIEISSSNYIDRRDIEEKSKILKGQQVKQIIEVYRSKLISQLEESIREVEGVHSARADIIINEDYNKEDFGKVLRVYAYITPHEETSGIKAITKIKEIKINDQNTSPDEGEEVDTKTKKLILEKIIKLTDINENDIVINIDRD